MARTTASDGARRYRRIAAVEALAERVSWNGTEVLPSDEAVVDVRHAGIVVRDMTRALAFYEGMLGLRIARDLDEHGEYIDRITELENVRLRTVKMSAPNGATLVELLEYRSHPRERDLPPESCAIGASHVAFTVRDLEGWYRRLSEAGVPFHAPPQLSPDGGARVTYCRDPDGTIVELVEVLAR